jgi:hypothetical protein
MVHRHIHGMVVTIYTHSVTETGQGYLSHTYSSQYSDPATAASKGGESQFEDTFIPLREGGPWVLAKRRIVTTEPDGTTSTQEFRFADLAPLEIRPDQAGE